MDIKLALEEIARSKGHKNYQLGNAIEYNTKEEWEFMLWEDSNPKPSWDEIVAAWPAANASIYSQRRQHDYPPITDQIDAIMKGFSNLIENGVELPQETMDWINTCKTIKEKYPKPENK